MTELHKRAKSNHKFNSITARYPYTGQEILEVPFGTGGDMAGEIFMYEVPAQLVRPGMTEDDAMCAAKACFGETYAPIIATFGQRDPNSREWVLPVDQIVWTPEGAILQRDYAGEPCHILEPVARSIGAFGLLCINHESSSETASPTPEDALTSGWRCPVPPRSEDY